MNSEIINDSSEALEAIETLFSIGMKPIPLDWDIEARNARSHIIAHASIKKDSHEYKDVESLKMYMSYNNFIAQGGIINGVAVKLYPPFAMLDFDLKNTEDKTVYDRFMAIINSMDDRIFSKIVIEKTRSEGYHVYFKYDKLDRKVILAKAPNGEEVISIYTNSVLSYCAPTPGYELIHNEWEDLDEFLTDDEFDMISQACISMCTYEGKEETPNNIQAMDGVDTYTSISLSVPVHFRKLTKLFDRSLPDDAFEQILNNDLTLFKADKQLSHPVIKFETYLRTGSKAAYSAKVFFGNYKKVLLFTQSIKGYPSFADRQTDKDICWHLTPSYIIYHKNNRSWEEAAIEIEAILEAIGVDIPDREKPLLEITDIAKISNNFPFHVFPKDILDSMMNISQERSLAPHFIATAGLWTISSLAGAAYVSDLGSAGKNILYCLMVAPVSAGKTPAFQVMCADPMKEIYKHIEDRYNEQVEEWNKEKEATLEAKKHFSKPKPIRFIPIATDGTTEGYIARIEKQPAGMGIYQDEAESIFNAGSYKSTNDAISFFNQAFAGGRIAQVRADMSKERVINSSNLNLLMGTQPNRLSNVFSEDKIESGFASRFLMVETPYIRLNENVNPFGDKMSMCQEWRSKVNHLVLNAIDFNVSEQHQFIPMTDDAKVLYTDFVKKDLRSGNGRIETKKETFVIGTYAKMSAYFPRFCQILALVHNHIEPEITAEIVQYAHDLFEYYAQSTLRVIGKMVTEVTTGLNEELSSLYNALPDEFTTKDAARISEDLGLGANKFKNAMRNKSFEASFTKIRHGFYARKYT